MNPVTIIKKPLFPALVHDDTTRIIVCVVCLLLVSYILYKVGKYYGQ